MTTAPSTPARTPAPAERVVVVVNYGSSELLRGNLASLTSDGERLSAVVVDNPTTQRERRAVTQLAQEQGWELLTPTENLGFGGGMNLGVAHALARGARSVLLLNPDAKLSAADAHHLLERAEHEPDTLVAPKIVTPVGAVWFEGMGLRTLDGSMVRGWEFADPAVEPWLTGACLAIGRDLWQRIGGFDEDYFLYWEDVDLSRRVREAGGRLVLDRGVTAVHDEGGTQGGTAPAQAKSLAYYYFNIRNRMVYARKHLTPAATRRWAATSPAAAREILLRGGRRQFLTSRAALGVAAQALADGLAWTPGTPTPQRAPHGGPVDTVRGLRDTVRHTGRAGAAASAATGGPATGGAKPLVVLQTFETPLPFANPYVKMLDEALTATGEVQVKHFSWKEALLGSYDVVHGHWPEDVMEATTPLKRAGKRATTALWLARTQATGIPLVRTLHNLELPSGIDPVKKALLKEFQRQTNHHILIGATSPDPGTASTLAVHGHYRDWFADMPKAERIPGRVGYFGLVRRYKNVEALARVFAQSRDEHPEWSLEIAGNPSGDELVQGLRDILGDDPRVQTTFRFLSDEEIVQVASRSQLVVLPYKEMHNSGSLLTALSLHRPCLVPDVPANRAVAEEVGPGWVYLYTGELEYADLSQRDWDRSARLHLQAYRTAIADRRQGRRR